MSVGNKDTQCKMSKNDRLADVLIATARYGLSIQNPDGSFPPGHNGPWNDTDTPVRVTAHYAMLYYYAQSLAPTNAYSNAMHRACSYLCAMQERCAGGGVQCRVNDEKNDCNGLIGQAWAAEPLLYIGIKECNARYLDCAWSILSKPFYDWTMHGWCPIEVTGKRLPFCRTVNQQIWFACMRAIALTAGMMDEDAELKDFLRFLHKLLLLNRRGMPQNIVPVKRSWLNVVRSHMYGGRNVVPELKPTRDALTLEKGYASFLLYGLAILEELTLLKKHACRGVYRRIFKSIKSIALHLPSQRGNPESFCWSYNPTGLEMAYVITVFQESGFWRKRFKWMPNADQWIGMQLESNLNPESRLMDNQTRDPDILRSRIYEAGRIMSKKRGFQEMKAGDSFSTLNHGALKSVG